MKNVLDGKARLSFVAEFVGDVFGEDMHAKRVDSLASVTLGALQSCSLAVRFIGQGLAQAHELRQKHCIKQVDRLFGNSRLNVWQLFADWVPYVVGSMAEIVVALEWTEFPEDGHATVGLSLVTGRGDATPLIWSTVTGNSSSELRSTHETTVLSRLRETLPAGCRVTVLTDRESCDLDLYKQIKVELGFDFVIRFRNDVVVEDILGERKPASGWVRADGKLRALHRAKVTEKNVPVAMVVFVRRSLMEEAWCLVGSRVGWKGREVVEWYGHGRGNGSGLRETRNYRFGLGMEAIRTRSCERRDRLYLVSALAIALLTLLGAAGEAVGLERTIKANTRKRRTYALFAQGHIYYTLLPGMKEEDACAIIGKFHELLSESHVFRKSLGMA